MKSARKSILRAFSATLILLGLGLSTTPSANASTATTVDSNVGQYTSTLTITKNGVTTVERSTVTMPDLSTAATGTGPQSALLHCNHAYVYPDSNGVYSIQHACGATSSPWGYRFSEGLCAIVSGPISETGMNWTRNGVKQGMQSPHPKYGCETVSYHFHGTYNPDKDYDKITYSDVFNFAVNGGGTAVLTIVGSFQTLGSTCSPTSC